MSFLKARDETERLVFDILLKTLLIYIKINIRKIEETCKISVIISFFLLSILSIYQGLILECYSIKYIENIGVLDKLNGYKK